MHVLESYALSCGLKVHEPYIYEKFIPVGIEKYITCDFNFYLFAQEVIDIIIPELRKKGIGVVQVDASDPLDGCHSTYEQPNSNQQAFLIKNSLLHVGESSFYSDLANHYKKDSINLCSNVYSNISRPFWKNKSKHISIEGDRKGNKPLLGKMSEDKYLQRIKPENIAQQILERLNIKYNYKYKNLFFGKFYTKARSISEIIPKGNFIYQSQKNKIVGINLCFGYERSPLVAQLQQGDTAYIRASKNLDIDVLKPFKKSIREIVYEVTENEDNPNLVKELIENGFKVTLLSYLNEKKLEKKKINYMEIGTIHQEKAIDPLEEEELKNANTNDLFYQSNLQVFNEGKSYHSLYHFKNDKEGSPYQIHKISDCKDFWREAHFFNILSLT